MTSTDTDSRINHSIDHTAFKRAKNWHNTLLVVFFAGVVIMGVPLIRIYVVLTQTEGGLMAFLIIGGLTVSVIALKRIIEELDRSHAVVKLLQERYRTR